jgi:hypothetical protein
MTPPFYKEDINLRHVLTTKQKILVNSIFEELYKGSYQAIVDIFKLLYYTQFNRLLLLKELYSLIRFRKATYTGNVTMFERALKIVRLLMRMEGRVLSEPEKKILLKVIENLKKVKDKKYPLSVIEPNRVFLDHLAKLIEINRKVSKFL